MTSKELAGFAAYVEDLEQLAEIAREVVKDFNAKSFADLKDAVDGCEKYWRAA